ncbi:hypothetical protein ACC695_39345, partial [Rhizobium ruizarguesonis]
GNVHADGLRRHCLADPGDVVHYGVFNGSRFRREIAPRIIDFVRQHSRSAVRPPLPRVIKGGREG